MKIETIEASEGTDGQGYRVVHDGLLRTRDDPDTDTTVFLLTLTGTSELARILVTTGEDEWIDLLETPRWAWRLLATPPLSDLISEHGARVAWEAMHELAGRRRGQPPPMPDGTRLDDGHYFCVSCWARGDQTGAHPYSFGLCDPPGMVRGTFDPR